MKRLATLARGLLALILAWLAWVVWQWAVQNATFVPDLQACRAGVGGSHAGACWGVLAHKGMDWLLGPYPTAWRWQALAALGWWTLSVTGVVGALRQAPGSRWRLRGAALAWLLGLLTLAGALPGLQAVPSGQWGGLPLTFLLATSAWLSSLPLAALLAWGRFNGPAAVSWACTVLIETVRGVPLVMWLFMAAFLLPALWPQNSHVGPVLRVWLVMTLFSSVYAAEILRGALGVLGRDGMEAARMLGASAWVIHVRVIWPQVLRTALPPLVSHSIGLIKDTSLVMIVNLQDLTGAMSVSLNGDPDWRPFFLEAYLLIAAAYALMCLGVAAVGRRLERQNPALGRAQ